MLVTNANSTQEQHIEAMNVKSIQRRTFVCFHTFLCTRSVDDTFPVLCGQWVDYSLLGVITAFESHFGYRRMTDRSARKWEGLWAVSFHMQSYYDLNPARHAHLTILQRNIVDCSFECYEKGAGTINPVMGWVNNHACRILLIDFLNIGSFTHMRGQ